MDAYRTARVTPGELVASPTITSTGTASPGLTPGGSLTFTCMTPATSVGAAPAYRTSASIPSMEPCRSLRRPMVMRILRLGILTALVCLRLPAPLIPGPNLARRTESADAIVVAKLVGGTTLASGTQVSSDIVLRVDRVLKGDVIPGSTIAAHLEGRGYFTVVNAKQSDAQPLYGIWFLTSAPRPYTVISRDGNFAELHFAPVILPEDAPAGKPGDTPAASVANELVTALRWLVETHGAQLSQRAQHSGTPEERLLVALSFSQFRTLTDDFSSLNASTTLPVHRQFALDKSAALRAVGIRGLIAANDPEGVKRAAADWSELAASADVGPIASSLMGYSNDRDREAVRALGALALRDPAEPGLRESAVYALRAIHTKETLPALVALLDHKEERVRPYALSGLCLFVRNAPPVTSESIPSMSWLQSRQPVPFLNPETQRYCLLGGLPDRSAELDAYASFWKSWWQKYRVEFGE
jgi:hypothetical protein